MAASVRGGRRRPGSSSVPLTRRAAFALHELSLSRDEALTRSAHRRHHVQPPGWRAAEAYNSYALKLTSEELSKLVAEIDRLVRPFIAMTREDVPGAAEVASLRLLAFRHPQAP
jgi:hypothetical protein